MKIGEFFGNFSVSRNGISACSGAFTGRTVKLSFVKTVVQIVGYFWVSLAAAIADFSSFILLYEIVGVQYVISNVVAFAVGLGVNYSLAVRFVFRRESAKTLCEFVAFSIIGLFGLAISCATLYVAIGIFGFGGGISKISSICTTFFWNFFIRKLLLFSKKNERYFQRKDNCGRRRSCGIDCRL